MKQIFSGKSNETYWQFILAASLKTENIMCALASYMSTWREWHVATADTTENLCKKSRENDFLKNTQQKVSNKARYKL